MAPWLPGPKSQVLGEGPRKVAPPTWPGAVGHQNLPTPTRVGRGAQVISVSVERFLLEQSDDLAWQMGITQARPIAPGLKAPLADEGEI
jgi:hypothetical protein